MFWLRKGSESGCWGGHLRAVDDICSLHFPRPNHAPPPPPLQSLQPPVGAENSVIKISRMNIRMVVRGSWWGRLSPRWGQAWQSPTVTLPHMGDGGLVVNAISGYDADDVRNFGSAPSLGSLSSIHGRPFAPAGMAGGCWCPRSFSLLLRSQTLYSGNVPLSGNPLATAAAWTTLLAAALPF